MPANLTPQYKSAEERYRQAKTTEEKISALEEMLAVMPKHKGTEHLQGDLKSRIAKLRKEGGKKAGAKRADPHKVEREGAAQVILIGPPNAGKSALMKAVTNAEPEVAPYPFSTQMQKPGMMPFEDIQIQLVDTPPLSMDYSPSWIFELVKYADAAVLVIDMSVPEPVEQIEEIKILCEENRITLCGDEEKAYGEQKSFPRRTIVAANKIDCPGAREKEEALRRYLNGEMPHMLISAEKSIGLDEFRRTMFTFLELVRVYTKAPQHKLERKDPDVFRRGSTVLEVAESIHHDLAENFKFAKIWGEGKFEGQRVPRDYAVQDGDIIEIHA